MMKLILITLLSLNSFLSFAHADTAVAKVEPWKGTTQVPPIEAGILTGPSFFGKESNWTVLGTGAYLLKDKAFVDDIDDRIWAEVQLGPSFFSVGNSSTTGMKFNSHLRWDFTYNEQ